MNWCLLYVRTGDNYGVHGIMEYKEHISVENGKKVLYVQVLKAIYGMIKSALRWYELFTRTLCGMGLELNPYDRCVANKMIDGSQCTVG